MSSSRVNLFLVNGRALLSKDGVMGPAEFELAIRKQVTGIVEEAG